MDSIFKKLSDRFTNFFTRSVAPSSIFFVLLFFNDKFNYEGEIYFQFISFVTELKNIDITFLYIVLTIIFLSYGYINQIFSQILDNFIKRNYCLFSSPFFEKCLDKKFINLKNKVEDKNNIIEKEIFSIIDFNDYNAYQVLGKDISTGGSYVDEVKSIHTFAVASLLNIAIYSFYFNYANLKIGLFFLLTIPLIVLFHFASKSRYKARNKRMYINYLLKKDKSKNEKEVKIKSIKVEIDE